MYFILTYHFVDNYLKARSPYRAAHFDHLTPHITDGSLLLGGATAEPADKGILIFKSESKEAVVAFAKSDPYVLQGIVATYEVQPWTVVAGALHHTS